MPREKTDMVKINFYIQPKVLGGLKKLARHRGTTYAQLLRAASEGFLLTELRKLQK